MENAKKNHLQYLSDCTISTMYLGNMPPKVAEKLQSINDIVRTEQYMDFITNRRFRSTLLCHSSAKLNRSINNEDIKSGIYNMADDESISTNDLVLKIATTMSLKPRFLYLPVKGVRGKVLTICSTRHLYLQLFNVCLCSYENEQP